MACKIGEINFVVAQYAPGLVCDDFSHIKADHDWIDMTSKGTPYINTAEIIDMIHMIAEMSFEGLDINIDKVNIELGDPHHYDRYIPLSKKIPFCGFAQTRMKDDGSPLHIVAIQIIPELTSIEAFTHVVAHEFQHIRQIHENKMSRLTYTIENKRIMRYENNVYMWAPGLTETEYQRLPWEHDANRAAISIVSRIFGDIMEKYESMAADYMHSIHQTVNIGPSTNYMVSDTQKDNIINQMVDLYKTTVNCISPFNAMRLHEALILKEDLELIANHIHIEEPPMPKFKINWRRGPSHEEFHFL